MRRRALFPYLSAEYPHFAAHVSRYTSLGILKALKRSNGQDPPERLISFCLAGI